MPLRTRIAEENAAACDLLPPTAPDGSRIGVNYVDAYLKPLNVTLDDGRAIACKRRGLNIELSIGDRSGEALLRRIEHGPDPKAILQQALQTAAEQAGAAIVVDDGVVYLEE